MGINAKDFAALQPGVAQLMKQSAEQDQLKQHGMQAEQLEKLKAYLKGQEQDASISKAKELYDEVPEGGSASVNGVSLGKGWNPAAQAGKERSGSSSALKHAQDFYNKGSGDLQKVYDSAIEGLNLTNDPNNPGSLGQGRTLMLKALGMNRYNEKEAEAVLPPTFRAGVSSLFNRAGGDESPLNEAERTAVNQFFQTQLGRVKDRHEMLKQQAYGIYQRDPYFDPARGQDFQQNVGRPFDSQLTESQNRFKAVPVTQGPNLTAAPNPDMIDRAKSTWNNFWSPMKGQQPAAATPPSASPPGGLAPPSAGTLKVKHIASGQTGTIPSNEFDPKIYQQLGQ